MHAILAAADPRQPIISDQPPLIRAAQYVRMSIGHQR
jgi:hypothetical protein